MAKNKKGFGSLLGRNPDYCIIVVSHISIRERDVRIQRNVGDTLSRLWTDQKCVTDFAREVCTSLADASFWLWMVGILCNFLCGQIYNTQKRNFVESDIGAFVWRNVYPLCLCDDTGWLDWQFFCSIFAVNGI